MLEHPNKCYTPVTLTEKYLYKELTSGTNPDKVITVGVAMFQLVIQRMGVSISIVQFTNQIKKVKVDALAALIPRTNDEAAAEVFCNLSRYHVVFKVTTEYGLCGSTLLS